VGWRCPKSPLELSSHACGDPPSPGAGGADLPPVGWHRPKSPLELSSHACGDPSSPGAGGRRPTPVPTRVKLATPRERRTYTSRLYWTIAPWDLPPGQREPRRARPAQLRFGKSHWGGPPAFPMAAMSSHGLGLIPCPPDTARKAPLELSSQACGDPPSPGAGGADLPPVGWRCPKSPLELSSQACGDPPSPGAGGADLPPVGWRCPKSPLELSSQACGDPSSPGAGGADPPPCPPESSLRGAAASPGPPAPAGRIRPGLYWTIAPWDLPPGQREPRRARPAQLRFGKSHWGGPPAFPMAAMSSHGLGLIPCPPDTARKAPLELSSQACGDPPSPGAGGADLPPVGWRCPKSPLELSSQACGDPPSPGAGGADLPPVGWRCPKSPLELSSHACGDPSSPGAGGADPPPCPPESSLRGAAASPGPPAPAGRIRPGLYCGSRPRRARGRGAVPGLPRSDPGCVLANPTGPPAFPMAAMSSHGLGLIPCPPDTARKAPLELSSQACGDPPSPGAGGADLPPVGWRCPKSPLELSSQACGDPSSPGAGGADPPPCPPESSLRGAAASPGPPAPAGRIRPGLYWTIAPWDLPPGSREPGTLSRPASAPRGGWKDRAGPRQTRVAGRGGGPLPDATGPEGPRRSPETGANPAKLGVPLDPEAAYPTPPGPSPGPRRSPEAGANPTKLGVPLDPEAAYPTPPGPSPGPRRSPEAGANPAKLGVPLDPEAAYPTPPGPSPYNPTGVKNR
ncbi:hypothetical protein M9458_050840, partial [Cirrhinus mrigala]